MTTFFTQELDLMSFDAKIYLRAIPRRYRTISLKKLIHGLVFNAYSRVKNPKVGSFFRAPEDLEDLRSQKNLIFQNAQIKV